MKALILLSAVAIILCCAGSWVEASTTGIISGVVTDKASGANLAGVNIVVEGTRLTAVTDADGFFVITNVAPGAYTVSASLVGYEKVEIADVQVAMDTSSTLELMLTQAVTEEKPAEVKVERPMVQPDVTPTLYMVTSKQEREVRAHPNYLYQIPGIVSTRPGIIVDPDGRPHIRGGRDNEIAYMLEGIPVTEPVSNVFATNTVTVGMDKLQVYTGGYRAEYGNSISGVLNEIKKTGSEYPGARLETTGGQQSYAGGYTEVGGVAPNGLDYYVGAYLWKTDFERLFYAKTESEDSIGKFVLPRGDKDKLTLLINQGSAIYSLDTTHTITDLSQPVPAENDHGHQNYQLVGLTWAHNFSDRSFVTIRPYVLNSHVTVDALGDTVRTFQHYFSQQKGLQFEYTNQLTQQHLLKAGISGINANNYYRAYVPLDFYRNPETGELPPPMEDDWGDYDYTADVNTFQTGIFIQDQIKLGEKWTTDVGVRYDQMKFDCHAGPDLSPSQTSPRFGMTFSPTKKSVWRFSWGKFIQYPMAYVIDRVYANSDWNQYRRGYNPLKPERATNWDVGYERQISDNLLGRITYFQRNYKDLIVSGRDVSAPGRPRIYWNGGDAKSEGVELYFNKKMSNDWDGWLSYTLMKARGDASDFRSTPGATVYLDWDQRHTLVAGLTRKSGKWTHSWMLDFGTGLADSLYGVDPSLQEHGKPHLILNYNVSRKLPAKSLVGDEMFLEIYNVFNTPRLVKKSNPPDPSSEGWVPPRFITLGVVKKF